MLWMQTNYTIMKKGGVNLIVDLFRIFNIYIKDVMGLKIVDV